MPAETVASTPLSIYDLAEKLGYTAAGIHKAIDRLGIQPEQITPSGFRYFSPLVLGILREHMRAAPNGK